MSTQTIDWDRVSDSIRRFGEHPPSGINLETGNLIQLLERGVALYGTSNDAELVPGLCGLYEYAIEYLSEQERYGLYREIEGLAEEVVVSLNAFMPFLLNETSLRIVSTAQRRSTTQ